MRLTLIQSVRSRSRNHKQTDKQTIVSEINYLLKKFFVACFQGRRPNILHRSISQWRLHQLSAVHNRRPFVFLMIQSSLFLELKPKKSAS